MAYFKIRSGTDDDALVTRTPNVEIRFPHNWNDAGRDPSTRAQLFISPGTLTSLSFAIARQSVLVSWPITVSIIAWVDDAESAYGLIGGTVVATTSIPAAAVPVRTDYATLASRLDYVTVNISASLAVETLYWVVLSGLRNSASGAETPAYFCTTTQSYSPIGWGLGVVAESDPDGYEYRYPVALSDAYDTTFINTHALDNSIYGPAGDMPFQVNGASQVYVAFSLDGTNWTEDIEFYGDATWLRTGLYPISLFDTTLGGTTAQGAKTVYVRFYRPIPALEGNGGANQIRDEYNQQSLSITALPGVPLVTGVSVQYAVSV